MYSQIAAETMIYKTLSVNQNIIGLVGTNPTNPTTMYQIYNSQAPIKAPYPLIVFNFVTGMNENDAKNTAYRFIYRFTAWSYNKLQSRELLGYIADSLDRKQLLISDKYAYQILERQLFTNLANVEGNQVYGHGATYEFLLE